MQNALLFCPILTKFGVPRHIFVRGVNIKFHEIPSSGISAVTCGQKDKRRDMAKLIGYFGDSANAPNKEDSGTVGVHVTP